MGDVALDSYGTWSVWLRRRITSTSWLSGHTGVGGLGRGREVPRQRVGFLVKNRIAKWRNRHGSQSAILRTTLGLCLIANSFLLIVFDEVIGLPRQVDPRRISM